jgi:membrane protease YdiL (CAAX protease family)
MAFTAFRDMKPFPQLMFSVFVILVSFLVFMVVSLIIVAAVFDVETLYSIPSLDDIYSPRNILVLKFLQVVQAIGLFIVPPIILGWLFYGSFTEYLFLNRSLSFANLVLVAVLIFFANPFVNLVGELNASMTFPGWLSGVEEWMRNSEEKATKLTEAFLNVETYWGLMFNLFMIAFLPAIGEELLFRGVIQRIFTNMTNNLHWGIWISAILFSALHMQFYGFVPRMLLGVLFGYLLVWSGSIWLPILAHFLNNGIAVVAMFMIDNNMLNPKVEEVGSTTDSYYMAALSLGLIFVFLIMLKRQNEGNNLQLNNLK